MVVTPSHHPAEPTEAAGLARGVDLSLTEPRRDPRGPTHDELREIAATLDRWEPVRRPVDVDSGDHLAGGVRDRRCDRRDPRRRRSGATRC